MIDKLLLLLLIIMLPVGIVASRQWFQPNTNGDKQVEEQEKKVEELISKLTDQMEQKKDGGQSAVNAISLTSVNYASGSGVLQIAGVAPSGKISLYYSVAHLPKEDIPELVKNQVIEGEVLGEAVELKAVKTKPDGSFVFEYPVKGMSQVVEMVLTQDQSRAVIQYDLSLNKRIL